MSTVADRGQRIVVVGAGPAGLTVAHQLAARGFANVVVLEAADRVGGKCWTVTVGDTAYELGAIGFPGAGNTFRRLAEAHGVRSELTWSYKFVEGNRARRIPFGLSPRLPFAALRLAPTLAKLAKPGYLDVPPALGATATRWLADHGLTGAAPVIAPLVTGLGYGFLDDIAAVYPLKHAALFRPDVYQLPVGSQRVWERIAATLDVRLDHAVTRISRSDDSVRVTTRHGELVADRVVLATAPDRILRFLDANAAERDVLSRFEMFRYHVLLCDAPGLPPAHYGFFTDAHARLEPGRPVVYARREPASPTTVIYSYEGAADAATSTDDAITARYREHLAPLGARITAIHKHHTWDYFPHAAGADISAGLFDRFDALQGAARTYYVGEALAYPTVRHVVDHATAITARFF